MSTRRNMSTKSADDALALLIIYTCLKNKGKKNNEKEPKRKRVWVKERVNSHKNLMKILQLSGPDDFRTALRIDADAYMELLNGVAPLIQKKDTHMRDAITPNERLSATLRFLAFGQSFSDLYLLTNISAQSLGKIIIQTCKAIITTFQSYIQFPKTPEEWKEVANEFENKFNFNNCIGAIHGKHINIVKPSQFGSYYYNYKKNFSVEMMAVVNANYEFLAVEVGTNGRESGESIFEQSELKQLYDEEMLNLPEPEKLKFSEDVLPYVIVGDDAFPLLENLMTPYIHEYLSNEEQIFNYRLSKAQYAAENAFRILSDRFGILRTTIMVNPEKVATIAHTCCYLHNFLMKRNSSAYLRYVDDTGRTVKYEERDKNLTDLEPLKFENASSNANAIRHKFCKYFNSVEKN